MRGLELTPGPFKAGKRDLHHLIGLTYSVTTLFCKPDAGESLSDCSLPFIRRTEVLSAP